MKIVAVIPARYGSSRFPGKPLADICGKPMIWWVYKQVKKVKGVSEVFAAIDDQRIADACTKYGIPFVMTRGDHPNHISRIWEVSNKVKADYYVCVNGDEPLIDAKCIESVLPQEIVTIPVYYGARRALTDPAEAIDFTNIKLAVNSSGRCLYLSRSPIPYPRGTLMFKYWKYVGIECFTKSALDLFENAPMGDLEKVEDIDHIRFLENGVPLFFKEVPSSSLSVDTPKDLEKVRIEIEEKLRKGGLVA